MSTRYRSIEQSKGVYKLCDIAEQVKHFFCKREAYTSFGEIKKDLGVAQALELIDYEYKEMWLSEFERVSGIKCWGLHLQNNYSSTLSTYYNCLIHLIWQYYLQKLDDDYMIFLSYEEEADEHFNLTQR